MNSKRNTRESKREKGKNFKKGSQRRGLWKLKKMRKRKQRKEGGRALPKDHLPLKVPTAIAKFPKEYLEWAPKSYVERIYNVQQWTEMTAGGHFAALEQPELLINDIIKFSKTIKKI